MMKRGEYLNLIEKCYSFVGRPRYISRKPVLPWKMEFPFDSQFCPFPPFVLSPLPFTIFSCSFVSNFFYGLKQIKEVILQFAYRKFNTLRKIDLWVFENNFIISPDKIFFLINHAVLTHFLFWNKHNCCIRMFG